MVSGRPPPHAATDHDLAYLGGVWNDRSGSSRESGSGAYPDCRFDDYQRIQKSARLPFLKLALRIQGSRVPLAKHYPLGEAK
jgi:hypothetical protein